MDGRMFAQRHRPQRLGWLVVLAVLAAPALADPPDAPRFALVAARPLPAVNPHGAISIPCAACHTEQGWMPLRDPLQFDHSEQTRFVMTGKHAVAECASCHLDLRFDEPKGTADECASCHVDVHRGQLGDDCLACHTTTDFNLTNGELIHARTSFPLTGAHLLTSCESCHTGDADGLFVPLDTDCFACHAADYQRTQSPPHEAAGFSTDCATCHSTLAFSDGSFDHALASGGFALVGAHAVAACAACHALPSFDPLFDAAGDSDCYACHAADYEQAETIDHDALGFPTECQQCHTTTAWEDARFDHVTVSQGFALVGAHEALACVACHSGPSGDVPFDPASQNDCVACHQAEHDEVHPSFPTDCLQCHNVNTWGDPTFEHEAASGGFALVGAHATLECSSCHAIPGYEPLFTASDDTDCYACHAEEHEDEHPDFPTNCLQCHTTSTWDDADFDHGAATGFALVGAHTALPCLSCHVGPDYELIFEPDGQNDCVACHAEEHEQAHPAFPTTCLQCHTTQTWDGASFDHAAAADGFALVGAHASLPCSACHAGPDFEPIFDPASQNDCVACHQQEHQEVHPSFPTNCLQCHTVDTWEGADFDHDPLFPIYRGKHEGTWSSCQTCHTQAGNFSVFSCLVCHEHRQSEMDDEHEDVGGYVYESTACLGCHPDGED